jgi:hypothetical protein
MLFKDAMYRCNTRGISFLSKRFIFSRRKRRVSSWPAAELKIFFKFVIKIRFYILVPPRVPFFFCCLVPCRLQALAMSTVGGLHNIDQQTGSSSKTPNPVFQPRCSRTPLSQLNKGDSVWRDSRTYARSAIQALELKKQQQQENIQRSRIPPPSAIKPVYSADERWVKAYRKAFPTFKIYFDGIEDLLRKRLEEKVKLLGSVSRFFF